MGLPGLFGPPNQIVLSFASQALLEPASVSIYGSIHGRSAAVDPRVTMDWPCHRLDRLLVSSNPSLPSQCRRLPSSAKSVPPESWRGHACRFSWAFDGLSSTKLTRVRPSSCQDACINQHYQRDLAYPPGTDSRY